MRIFSSPPSSEMQTRTRILQAAQRLFAAKALTIYTKASILPDLAGAHYSNKTESWIEENFQYAENQIKFDFLSKFLLIYHIRHMS